MQLQQLKNLFQADPKILEISQALSSSQARIGIQGLIGSSTSFLLSAVFNQKKGRHILIAEDQEKSAYFLNDLQTLLGPDAVHYFPSTSRRPYYVEEVDNANILERAEVLSLLSNENKPFFLITYPEALSEKVVSQKVLATNTLFINRNEKLNQDFVIDMLHEYGFNHTDYVAVPGEFAIRGGIIDVYSYSHELPYRIEFFDDEVESVRAFDPSTQLSVVELNKISITPNVQGDLLNEERVNFFDFFASGQAITCWFENFEDCLLKVEKNFEKAEKAFEELGQTLLAQLPPLERFLSKTDFIKTSLNFASIELKPFLERKYTLEISFSIAPQPTFQKNFELLGQHLAENFNQGILNIICCDSAKQAERLQSIFKDISPKICKILQAKEENLPPNNDLTEVIATLELIVHEGFLEKDKKVAIYTDHQIFDRYHRFKLKERVKKSKEALTLKELSGLQPGDFVTHIDHGVGKFAGLEKIEVNGKSQEAIRLVYRDNDILYVSIHSLHRIAKYSGKEGEPPKVHKLGSGVWATQKAKTKAKVKDIAKDLIELYAKRRAQKGFSFTPDTYLQNELEASFIYEDTPDQLKATQDVKRDMEQDFPMDRLICGDVGFGKTEVAIRSAFKAACDGKQVAVLVPTTILALQHYKTFSERLKDFPVNVDYLNRFKSSAEQKKTIENTTAGKVDILIGTHRLVSKDVKFKDLGLMIIDEEQKFGVSTKEKLKQMKVNVDTLTLTATPIPRTLQFSLMGARDLSVIATPPPNRYPVETRLSTYSEELVRDAVAYEIARGGQVFFIHNRVQNIYEVAGMIQRLVPDARVSVGHGQMEGDKLEEIMLGFIEGETDVLVSTTIVESGLDIPNANTILINDAHKFGLSDLHQMRGRVGRSNKKAFCYLLTLPASLISGDARRRLKALEDFSDLGSGFNIAMRDLDIRGAGNILGAEQSGFISEIGFEMYQKILDEALNELKPELSKTNSSAVPELNQAFGGRNLDWSVEALIDTDLEILLPDSYVNSISERILLYKRLDDSRNETELQNFEKNLSDRFGPPPPPVVELLNTIRLRWLAQRLGMEKVVLKMGKMVCYFISNQDSAFYQSDQFTNILRFVQKNPGLGKMKESADKFSISFDGIKSVKTAMETLSYMEKE
jgi:transcription-repair coupling factor (superfamily II helicase)